MFFFFLLQDNDVLYSLLYLPPQNPISSKMIFMLPDVVPDKQPIQGIGSVVETLRAFQTIWDSLQDQNPELSPNLSPDLSGLCRYLEREMTNRHCPARKPRSFKDLDTFLKNHQTYSTPLRQAVLPRLKDYINRLLLTPDTLMTCWTDSWPVITTYVFFKFRLWYLNYLFCVFQYIFYRAQACCNRLFSKTLTDDLTGQYVGGVGCLLFDLTPFSSTMLYIIKL